MSLFPSRLLAAAALVALLAAPAWADCTNPTGGAGTMFYNSTYNTMQYCNGTNWVNMGAPVNLDQLTSGSTSVVARSTGVSITGHVSVTGNMDVAGTLNVGGQVITPGGIPTGAVMAFDLAACPTGWSEYTAARGRFLRGIDNGAGNDPSGTRALGNVQDDALKSHFHSVDPPSTSTSSGGAHTHTLFATYFDNYAYNSYVTTGAAHTIGGSYHTTSSNGDHTHTVNIAAFDSAATGATETRPKNVAVLFCRKD